MGKGFINRAAPSINKSDGALIRVSTFIGADITCTDGETTFKNKCTSENPVEFVVDYGYWTIISTINGKTYTRNVNVDIMEIYNIDLLGYSYGISIDMSNSDPTTAVSYIDDAVGFTPLSVNLDTGVCDYGDWEDIITNDFGCRPCLYKEGRVYAYLNPNDYSKSKEGLDMDIYSGNSGDVMVEFKKTWYKYSVDGNILTFQIANYDRSEDGFVCSAFKSMDGSGTVKDYMYYGAYEGYTDSENNKIRSISNKNTNSGGLSFSEIRTYCQNNGSSYGMEDWCKRCYLLGLLMLVTKTRDIQSAIGYGCMYSGRLVIDEYGEEMGESEFEKPGALDKAGLFAGYNTTDKSVKAFGIENLWGNYPKHCSGIMYQSIFNNLGIRESQNDDFIFTSGVNSFEKQAVLYPISAVVLLNGAVIYPITGQADIDKGWSDAVYIDIASIKNEYFLIGGSPYLSSDKKDMGPFSLYINYGQEPEPATTRIVSV